MAERLIYGVGPVRELVHRRSRDIVIIYVNPARHARQSDPVAELAKEARGRGVAVETRSREELDALSRRALKGQGGRLNHQGVVALVGEFVYADLDDLMGAADVLQGDGAAIPLWVALDSIQDPHNLGAIVRSAYVLGASAVLIPDNRAAHVTPVVTKAAAGATELLPIVRVTNLARALTRLKEGGIWLAALAASEDAATQSIDELDATLPLCLVIGAEGTGIRRLVAQTCDFQVQIPMAERGVGSLNASVAAGIALYEVARQRRLKAKAPPEGESAT